MKKKLQDIYLKLPCFMQNIIVSSYGLKLFIERYGPGARKFEAFLEQSQKYSKPEINLYQEKMFIRIAKHAVEHVPFYRDWARENGLSSNDFQSIHSIKMFPIVEKEDLRKSPEKFLSELYAKKKVISMSTSGSTGTPIHIFCDQKSRTFHYAFFTRLRKWYGIKKRAKRVTFLGRVIVSSTQKKPPFWRYDLIQRNLIMSAYHLSDEKLIHYYKKIKKFRPEEIFGYASSIYRIAQFINEKELERLRIKAIITTAETLLPYQREAIEKAFDTQVVDQYGCAEMAFFAAQSPSGAMFFHPEHAIIETLDNDRELPQFTGNGEVIATSLVNEVMPLIRYRVGDKISLADESDSFHPGFQRILSLEGRTDDVILTKDGRSIGRMSPIFRSDKEIKAAQVVQDSGGTITIYVVPTEQYTDEHRGLIYSEALERIGDSVPILIKEVNHVKIEPNGKFRPVKSYFSQS
jgi:phenylacetate-CoA ligase